MNKLYIKLLLGLGLTAVVMSSLALQVPDLYVAQRPVDSRALPERKQAIKQGLLQVLARVSGNTAVYNNTQLRVMIQQPDRFVQRYTYVTKEDSYNTDSYVQALQLRIEFDSRAINNTLRQVKLPVWQSDRPLSMVWLALETAQDNRQMIADIDTEDNTGMPATANLVNQLGRQLREQATTLGLPIVLPMLDLTDMQNVSIQDVWGLFSDVVARASKRYDSDTTLVGRIFQRTDGRWQGDFAGQFAHALINWSAHAQTPRAVAEQAMAQWAFELASRATPRGAIGSNSAQNFFIRVNKIQDNQDYAHVLNYLRSLSVINQLDVVQVSANHVLFSVKLAVDRQGFERTLRTDRILMPDPMATMTQNQTNQLTLRYAGDL